MRWGQEAGTWFRRSTEQACPPIRLSGVDGQFVSTMPKNVFVFGLDDFNRKKLDSIRHREEFRFHSLLDPDQVREAKEYSFESLLAQADEQLAGFDGPVDGIVTFWDFPSTVIHPILCRKYGLPGPPLQSVIRCEHKYWSRFLQNQVIRDYVPRFHAFDPFDPESVKGIPLEYPYWVKPVASYSGFLAFKIHDDMELKERMEQTRAGIGRYARPFAELWPRLDPPAGAEHVDGQWCIAEAPIQGHQCTVEGYVHDGNAKTYGVIDSFRTRNGVSFHRYQYPSGLPSDVRQKIGVLSRRVMEHVGYNNAAFNVEWMWDSRAETLRILEINSRISQSHSDLFEKVNGLSNHEAPVQLAVGNEPNLRGLNGVYDMAAEVFIRQNEDGLVKKVPTPEEIKQVEARVPGTTVKLGVAEGMRLSEVLDQDAYSYRLAVVYVGGRHQTEILKKAEHVESMLEFEIEPLTTAPKAPAR